MYRGSVGSLADKMDKLGPLMTTQQEYQEGDIIFHRDMAADATLTRRYSALELYRQTETADRVVTVKEGDYRAC